MKKRNLKADLELVRKFRSKWRQSTCPEEIWKIGVLWEDFCRDKVELWLEQALAEKERARKAEELARELVAALEIAYDAMYLDIADAYDYPNCELKVEETLKNAKEVLGDE